MLIGRAPPGSGGHCIRAGAPGRSLLQRCRARAARDGRGRGPSCPGDAHDRRAVQPRVGRTARACSPVAPKRGRGLAGGRAERGGRTRVASEAGRPSSLRLPDAAHVPHRAAVALGHGAGAGGEPLRPSRRDRSRRRSGGTARSRGGAARRPDRGRPRAPGVSDLASLPRPERLDLRALRAVRRLAGAGPRRRCCTRGVPRGSRSRGRAHSPLRDARRLDDVRPLPPPPTACCESLLPPAPRGAPARAGEAPSGRSPGCGRRAIHACGRGYRDDRRRARAQGALPYGASQERALVLRIVYVAYHGGVHTRRWVSFFAQRGHDVHVVTCGGAGGAEGWAVHDLGPLRGGRAGYLMKVPAARRIVRALNPDVVHAHWATSYGLLALAAGRRPLVVTAHGDDLLIAPRNPVLRPIVARVLRAASLITVPSEQMRDAARALVGKDLAPLLVFQYGVETDRLEQLAHDSRNSASRTLRIVSARPLLALYHVDELVRALALLRDRGVELRCTIAGEGPEKPSLEALAQGLGLGECVRFVGQRPPGEVEALVAAADVGVSIAESDGASLALLESMALGCVPVVSDIPANRAWIEDGLGGVVVPIEAAAVADGIARAAALDRSAVAAHNLAIVRERADRTRNLSTLERHIVDLAAVAA